MEIIYFNLCAIMAMTALALAILLRKLVKGRTNRIFIILLAVIIISGIADSWNLLYGPVIMPHTFNTKIRRVLINLYFITRNGTTPLYILYVASYMGIWHKVVGKTKLHLFWAIPIVIDLGVLFSNAFNGLVFSFSDNFEYQRGPLLYVLYVVAFYYLLLSLVMLVKHRYLLPRGKYIILLVFLPVNIISVLVQLVFFNIRIELFATAIWTIAMAIEVQRPEEMVDYVVGTGSYNAFLTDTKRNFMAKNPSSVLFIKFTNYNTLRTSIGLDFYSMMLRRMADKMYQMSKIMGVNGNIYYLDQGAFAVSVDIEKHDSLLDMGRILTAYMQEPINLNKLEIMLNAKVCLVDLPNDISNQESFLNFASTFHHKLPDTQRVISLSTVSDSKDFKMRNDMDAIINRGIKNNGFQMYYQPIYSIKQHKFVSAEALIRLQDDKYGFVSPALFIPAAEESGAIHQIGDFVLEDVCRFIGSSDFETLGLEYIEVNLSVAQCIEANLFEKIDGLMKKYGVKPSQINLEITETGVDYDPVTTDRNINLLKESGISFSLDDYGTGYSSIKRVVTLPLDIVKLDKSLVDEMDSPMMWTVIRNTVNMLQRMRKKILVEGVEDKRALDRFAEIGCDYIQGYFFSKPLSEEKFLEFIVYNNLGLDILP